jgi:putative glycosyltransferase
MRAVLERITSDYEIILVNDGSPDESLAIAITLQEENPRIRVIDLSRNFGHHKAMMTGFGLARGDLVFQIDCDLEEDPELLAEFHRLLTSSDVDVVYGVRREREGPWLDRVSGNLFWWLFNRLSSYPVPGNLLSACLMSRRYVASLVAHQDQEVFLPGLQAITGFKQVPFVSEKRCKGRSTYTLRRKLALLVNAITSFSNAPLILIFHMGCLISLLAGGAAFYLAVRRLFLGIYPEGWTSLIVSLWLLGGLIIFCIGVIGIYLSKIFMETKRRPYTIIRQLYDHPYRPQQVAPEIRRAAADRFANGVTEHPSA